jgi:hypothetical protein
MSAPVNVLTIAGSVFPLTIAEFSKKVRQLDPETKKNKMVETKYPVILPEFKTVSAASALFVALCTFAEEKEAGNGLKLAQHFLNEQLEDACDESFNKETGNLDAEKWLAVASAAERARSAGQSVDNMYKELALLGTELAIYQRVGGSADGWKTVLDKDGSPRFGGAQEFVLRLNEVLNKMDNLTTLVENKTAELEKRRAEREAKAAEAKTVAAAAAAAATPAPAE